MGTIFLVYIMLSVCRMSVVCQILRRQNYVAHAHAQSHFWAVKTLTCDTRVIDFDYALEQLYHDEKETFT